MTMSEMFNPPHPGKVLREYMGDTDITSMARHLHISRVTLSRILNGSAGISAEMSLRLGDALGTHPSFWYDMQSSFDMWQAKQKKRPHITRLKAAQEVCLACFLPRPSSFVPIYFSHPLKPSRE